MTMTEEIALAAGAIAAALLLGSNLMKRMMPLRVLALASNVFFIVHYALHLTAQNWALLLLQVTLVGVNLYRIWDLKQLSDAIDQANADTPLKDWLLPHMRKKKLAAGTMLFSKGDRATEVIYIKSGTVRIVELDQTLGAGSLVGEIGLFAEDRKRTASIRCETACVCYTMTDEAIYLLYYQNPKLGFFLVRLIVQRLIRDLQRAPANAAA